MKLAGSTGMSTIIDFIVKLFEILRFSNLFPAAILIWINIWLFFPAFSHEVPFFQNVLNLDEKWKVFGSVFTISVISYIFSALNDPIFRFFEGYPFKMSKILGTFLINTQKKKKQRYQNIIKNLESEYCRLNNLKKNDKINERLDEIKKNIRIFEGYLDDGFPSEIDPDMLPTKLGNRTAAFECYPEQKYCIDGVMLWTRFIPVLVEKKYIQFVEKEKNLVDFFLYLSLLVIFFLLEYIYLSLAFVHEIKLSIISFLIVASCFFYLCACQSVIYWGDTYKTAFDLYRDELRKTLRIRNFNSFRDERFAWRAISQFFKSNKKSDLITGGINLNYQMGDNQIKGENHERT